MTDQLSRVFQALADPTRRDLVARLAAGGRDRRRARRAVRRQPAGRLQAPEGARGGRAGEPHGTRNVGRAPGSGGVRPDDEVDRALPAGAEERFQRLDVRAGAHGRRRDTTTRDKEQHHDARPATPQTEITSRGGPDHRDQREFDAPVEQAVPRLGRPRAVRAVGRPPQHRRPTSSTWDCPHGRSLPLCVDSAMASEFRFYGSFHEVRPNERIVQTFTYEGFRTGWRSRP